VGRGQVQIAMLDFGGDPNHDPDPGFLSPGQDLDLDADGFRW